MPIEVIISEDLLCVDGQHVVVDAINQVEVRSSGPHIAVIIFQTAAVIFALAAFDAPQEAWKLLKVSVVSAAIAYLLQDIAALWEYEVVLVTPSSETRAFLSRNEDEAWAVREQVQRALARRFRTWRF